MGNARFLDRNWLNTHTILHISSCLLAAFLCICVTGCGTQGTKAGSSDSDPQNSASTGNDNNSTEKSSNESKSSKSGANSKAPEPVEIKLVDLTNEIQKIRDAKPTRSLEGRWHLRVRQELQELATSLFEIKKDKEGSLTIKALELPLQGWKFESGVVTGNTIEIKLKTNDDGEISFTGTLYKDVVLGSFQFPSGESLPARLTSTKDKSMDGKAVGLDFDHVDEFSSAYDDPVAKTSVARLFQFAQKYPLNPLTLQAYIFILRQAKSPSTELSDEDILLLMKNLSATAQLWGKPRVLGSYTGALGTILDQGYKPETLLEIVNSARNDLGETLSGSDEVAIFDYAEGRALLNMEDTEKVQKGIELLKSNPDEGFLKLYCNFELARFAKKKNDQQLLESLLKENPLDPSYTFVLGQIADEKGDYDKALEYYSIIASLPGLESILREIWTSEGERVASPQILSRDAWTRLNKNDKGFNEHLDKIYHKHIYAFTKKDVEVPPKAKNQKTILCELFTGSSCSPCVAADVALGGIEQSIPDTGRFIALRYHFHNPAPDPLTVREGQIRYNFYESNSDPSEPFGTPTFFLNGKRTTQMGGSLLNVSSNFQTLLELIEPELKKTTTVEISASAKIQDNTLKLSASAIGLPENTETLKLRLALAQKSVSYKSRNGVRIHEMLVRDMPGGAAGISPKDGKLEFSTEVTYDGMMSDLRDYLSMVEQSMGIIFPVRPLEIKELQLVAFVQNDETLEVLHTIHIPIEGEFVIPPKSEKPAESESDTKTPDSKPETEETKKDSGPSLVPAKPDKSEENKTSGKEQPSNSKEEPTEKSSTPEPAKEQE